MSPSLALLMSVFLPMVGGSLALLIGSDNRQWVRRIALVVTLVTLLLVLRVAVAFQTDGDVYMQSALSGELSEPFAAEQTAFAATEFRWLPPETGIDVRFSLGVDGLSIWMYALTAILMVSAVLVSWEAIADRPSLFYCMLMFLQSGCLGVFAARDIILFYVFFEFTLIPLFFLIGIWGSEDRRYAAVKFFLYTLVGSLFTFLGLLFMVLWNHYQGGQDQIVCSIPELTLGLARTPMPVNFQICVFVALFAGFAIKVPLFPLHTWLPLAHVQAPTAGSVILAGILLKIGTYGFLRFNLPLLPEASATCLPWVMWLSVLGIIYGALVALVQSDIKRLIAYSSVSHLGFCMLGLFALTPLGVHGAALQMVNHGISTGALFAIVGMLYERYHTREIAQYGGLSRRLPVMAFFMLLFTFSSIGLPGLNGFAGEIMILIGAFQRGWGDVAAGDPWHLRWVSVLAVSGVVLGAWYMLWLVKRVFFGRLHEPAKGNGAKDLCFREVAALTPLAILVFWIGLYPKFFLDRMSPALNYSTDAAAQIVATADCLQDDVIVAAAKEDDPRAH